jgi:hypothetical protein
MSGLLSLFLSDVSFPALLRLASRRGEIRKGRAIADLPLNGKVTTNINSYKIILERVLSLLVG